MFGMAKALACFYMALVFDYLQLILLFKIATGVLNSISVCAFFSCGSVVTSENLWRNGPLSLSVFH